MQEDELKRGEKLLEKEKRLSALKKVIVTCVLFGLGLFFITNVVKSHNQSSEDIEVAVSTENTELKTENNTLSATQLSGSYDNQSSEDIEEAVSTESTELKTENDTLSATQLSDSYEISEKFVINNKLNNLGNIYERIEEVLNESLPSDYSYTYSEEGFLCTVKNGKSDAELVFFAVDTNGQELKGRAGMPDGFILLDNSGRDINYDHVALLVQSLFENMTYEEALSLAKSIGFRDNGYTNILPINGVFLFSPYSSSGDKCNSIVLYNDTIEYQKMKAPEALVTLFGGSTFGILSHSGYTPEQQIEMVNCFRANEAEIRNYEALWKVFSNYEDGANTTESDTTKASTETKPNKSTTVVSMPVKTIEHYCEVDGCTNEGTYKITGLNGTDEYYCFKHYTEMDNILESMEQETQASTKSTHYCESSGCYNEGTHKIMGLNGYYEYYCDKHYKEINDILGRMEQDVGSGSQSKHQCEVGGCSKEGTHSMVGLNGTMEYYCTEHYNEMAEIMQMLTGGS